MRRWGDIEEGSRRKRGGQKKDSEKKERKEVE